MLGLICTHLFISSSKEAKTKQPMMILMLAMMTLKYIYIYHCYYKEAMDKTDKQMSAD
jgi:hypothetical protein